MSVSEEPSDANASTLAGLDNSFYQWSECTFSDRFNIVLWSGTNNQLDAGESDFWALKLGWPIV
jgi:hypothetical protein